MTSLRRYPINGKATEFITGNNFHSNKVTIYVYL